MRRRLLLAMILVLASRTARSQDFAMPRPAPVLREIFPAAGQSGATVRVRLGGKYLGNIDGMLASHPGIRAKLFVPPTPAKEEKTDKKKRETAGPGRPNTLQWDVSIGADVPGGFHELRVHNDHGVSAPRLFHVSSTPVVTARDPAKSEPVRIVANVRYCGRVEKGEVEVFTLESDRDQRLVVECLGERIDSSIDATLEVKDASGRRVVRSSDRIYTDPAAAFDAKKGETYRIEVWDFVYGSDLPYVLTVSTRPKLLFAYPPALAANGESRVTFYGWNLPGSRPAGKPGAVIEALDVRVDASTLPSASGIVYRPTTFESRGTVEARPPGMEVPPLLLVRANDPISNETEPNDRVAEATRVDVPSIVCARFGKPRDRDWFVVDAKKGQRLEISLSSSRLGYPCDPILLVVRREVSEKNGEKVEKLSDLVYLNERETTITKENSIRKRFIVGTRDPVKIWTVPEDGTYHIQVRNRGGSGRRGVEMVYALTVREATPDFDLFVVSPDMLGGAGVTARRGAAETYDVILDRRGGFDGVVEVRAEGLSKGVTCPPVFIGRGDSHVPLVLSASADAPESTTMIRVVGRAKISARDVERQAVSSTVAYGLRETRHPLQYTHCRLSQTIPLAVRPRAPFGLRARIEDVTLAPGEKLKVPVTIERESGFDGAVRISFVGFNERGFPNDNGERQARATIAKGKKDGEHELSIQNRTELGVHSLLVFGSTSIDFREEIGNRKSRKNKFWWSTATPVTVRLVKPVVVELGDLGGRGDLAGGVVDLAAGADLHIPLRVARLEGRSTSVDVRLETTGDANGLAAKALRVEKNATSADVIVATSVDRPLGVETALRIRARFSHAGRNYEDQLVVPFRVRSVAPLTITTAAAPTSACPGGVFSIPYILQLAEGVEGDVRLDLSPRNPGGLSAAESKIAADIRSGSFEVRVGPDAKGTIRDVELAATLTKSSRRFTASVALPELRIEPAFSFEHDEKGDDGLLAIKVRRHDTLELDREVTLKISVEAANGGKTALDAEFSRSENETVLKIDRAALRAVARENAEENREGGKEDLFPLHIKIDAKIQQGGLAEEHLLKKKGAAGELVHRT